MAFWGIEVKPGKPYTHSSKDGRGRLRISQATLATGSTTVKSLVQCNVGDKSPVLLCALIPDQTESLQLDLEFDEAEDVIFSVIGPRGVYLTGYYVGHSRHSIMQDDTESFGEDIANSETQESNHHSDEDEYEDSFINDDEPEPLTSSEDDDIDDDDDEYLEKKKRDGKGGRRRLKKKIHLIESDDDDVDFNEIDVEKSSPISSIKMNKSENSGKKIKKETKNELVKETKNKDDELVDSQVLDSKDDINVQVIDKTEEKCDEPNEVMPESELKPKKKKRDSSKEKKNAVPSSDNEENTNNVNDISAPEIVANELNRVSAEVSVNEVKTKKKKGKKGNVVKDDENHIDDVVVAKDDEKPNNMSVDRSLEVLTSGEVITEDLKPKKKRKTRGNKQEDDQQTIDKASGNQSDEKKVKKKRRKTSENEENTNMEVENENNKKTLSNGLVIEELVTVNNSKRKIAATGKKVKVQYEVKLKESGQVIDSNGESLYKFRLGDKEVIEGLNVGVEGMRVGDKRRLTIPPSMSVGFIGTGENIPPNSWLVYDVEMCSVH